MRVVEAEACCAGIRMNAGHLVLGYMPPFQAMLFPVVLQSLKTALAVCCITSLLVLSQM